MYLFCKFLLRRCPNLKAVSLTLKTSKVPQINEFYIGWLHIFFVALYLGLFYWFFSGPKMSLGDMFQAESITFSFFLMYTKKYLS